MYRYRFTYWSNTIFADFIRGTKKLTSGTGEEWENWEQKTKNNNPIRYWITEYFLDSLQDVIYYPYDLYLTIYHYTKSRFIYQSTKLKANKKHLTPGTYHDYCEKILFCLFDELVDFVEIECANMNMGSKPKEERKKVKYSLFKQRYPEEGIEYLTWAASLNDYGTHYTEQALAAQKVLELYYWWLDRDNRPDVYEESGYDEYYKNSNNILDFVNNYDDKLKSILKKVNELELKYLQEDQDKLHQLIDIRMHLFV